MKSSSNLSGKEVLVLGLGVSGKAAAELALFRGARVTVIDENESPSLQKRADGLRQRGAEVYLNGHLKTLPGRPDLLVVSPGVRSSHRLVREAREEGIEVIGEVELASRCLKIPMIAVTGTNGKTTTVKLIETIVRAAGETAIAAGNIGYPLARVALDPAAAAVAVTEISSFQLETVDRFRPRQAVLLDITPDHLDRHSDYEEYFRLKMKIFENQAAGDLAVIPDRIYGRIAPFLPKAVATKRFGPPAGTVRCEGGYLVEEDEGGIKPILALDPVGPLGPPNRDNLSAAAALALARGISPEIIGAALDGWKGLPHRFEEAGRYDGVVFYNDSKATNPSAASAALSALRGPVIWIAGGSEKGLDYSPLAVPAAKKVKLALLLGESREKLAGMLDGRVDFRLVESLKKAVGLAVENARPGDTVLLSPGCASFDMFQNYRDRGDRFKDLVKEFING